MTRFVFKKDPLAVQREDTGRSNLEVGRFNWASPFLEIRGGAYQVRREVEGL